jgi:hypothetical protein
MSTLLYLIILIHTVVELINGAIAILLVSQINQYLSSVTKLVYHVFPVEVTVLLK